jgi:multimeric flavodoxin WrbA
VQYTNMTVLGISGSTRKDGNTAHLVKVILNRCERAGLKTEFVSLAGKKINPCLGCEKCKEKAWCVVQNDDWAEIMEKVLDSEVLVIGSPTYYYDVCGHLKNFIDRSYSLFHNRRLAGRKAVAVAVCANKGGGRTIETLEGFLNSHEFSYLGGVRGKGYLEGDILKDTRALKRADELGDKIVKLLKPID